ncbi:MAG: hypothetical protein EOO38_22950, partial [Cytophagaceae bacterium]
MKFASSGDKQIQQQFNFATALLHSFEYDEAEKAYAKIIETDPGYAMAYWGVAMSNFHPLWTAPEEPELTKGSKALRVASSIENKSSGEKDYIQALHAFYDQWETTDHYTRCQRYEKAMEGLYKKYPDDIEAGIFYALAINAAADPADQTFSRQRKAGEILEKIGVKYPDHPGVIHYIIHTYDSPGLAHLALKAARKYASIAPASAHAQHMPSHIFTRLGYWDESIQSNIASTESAKCYAETAGIKGHWDEELHGMDYHKRCLLSWSRSIARLHDMRVTNLTTSFANPKVLEVIVDTYLPPTMANSIGDGRLGLAAKLKAVGCSNSFIALFTPQNASARSIPSRDFTLLTLSFLASRLLPLCLTHRAASSIQRAFRQHLARRRTRQRITLMKVAHDCAVIAQAR